MTATIVMPDGDTLCARLFSTPERAERLNRWGGITVHEDAPIADPAVVVERCRGARAVVFGWPLPDEVLALPEVQMVTFMGTGAANHVDLAVAARHGVTVCNTPGYGDAAVAEHAVALMLASLRGIPRYDRALRHEGVWLPSIEAPELGAATVGLVGFGGIARHVARLLRGFGSRILVAVRDPERHRGAEGIELVGIEELFERSDVVSLHLALTAETAGVIGRDLLDRLRPGALLVNTARAELLDEARLLELVRTGVVTAALDVFDPEPLSSDHRWRDVEGLLLTPHVAFNTPDAMERMADLAVANVAGFLAGHPVNVVS